MTMRPFDRRWSFSSVGSLKARQCQASRAAIGSALKAAGLNRVHFENHGVPACDQEMRQFAAPQVRTARLTVFKVDWFRTTSHSHRVSGERCPNTQERKLNGKQPPGCG